jgi:hypothetical protein
MKVEQVPDLFNNVAEIIKNRFPNLTVKQTLEITGDIVKAVDRTLNPKENGK